MHIRASSWKSSRKTGRDGAGKEQKSAGNSICQTRQDCHTHELTVTVTTQIKPSRGQASQNPSLDWEGLVKSPPPPPAKELLALDGQRDSVVFKDVVHARTGRPS